MQDEKEIVKEENAVPEEAQEEAVPKESEADTEVTQEESVEAEKKPRKEKKLFKKDRTAELEAKIAELEQALYDKYQLSTEERDYIERMVKVQS